MKNNKQDSLKIDKIELDSIANKVQAFFADSTSFFQQQTEPIIESPQMAEQTHWFTTLLENNPGFANIAITGLSLPLLVLFLTNQHQRKMKNVDRELGIKYGSKEDLRNQEKQVYASLSKILFDVQQLHVALSGTCVDENCINDGVKRFDESVTKYHEEISNNLLYLSSETINNIYTFYNRISEPKIELKDLNENKNFGMAHVCVYQSSEELAQVVIDLQEKLVKKRTDIHINFDKTKQEMMKYCCGRRPLQDLIEKYEILNHE